MKDMSNFISMTPFERNLNEFAQLNEGFWGDVGDVAKAAAEGFADGAKQGWREAMDEYRAKHGYGYGNRWDRRRNNYEPELEDEHGQGLLDLDTTGFGENMKYRTLDYAKQFTQSASVMGAGRYEFSRRIVHPEQNRRDYIPCCVYLDPLDDSPRLCFGCIYDEHGSLKHFSLTNMETNRTVEPHSRNMTPRQMISDLVSQLKNGLLESIESIESISYDTLCELYREDDLAGD